MRPTSIILATLTAVTIASSASAFVTPIDSLNYATSNGVALYNRRLVTVQGTVTCQDSILSPTNTDVMIQDATGGVNVFTASNIGAYGFVLGDSVQVTGFATNFHGGVELDSTAALLSVTHLGPASVFPDPVVATCSQIANGLVPLAPPTYYEPYQGRLVRVNGLHITSGSWPTTKLTVNTSLTVTDATGVPMTLFIFRSSGANGSPDPGAKFDAIGVVKQFGSTSPPWTNGYELCPRYTSDVIPECPGPQFAALPATVSVDSLTATVAWSTDVASSSTLYYGATTSYGNAVVDPNVGTQHQVTLTGLTARTLYHMQATATDVNGTCPSLDKVFVTWPSPGTPGDISIWFNRNVDATARGPEIPVAQGNVDLSAQAVALINRATVSVDAALYSFSLVNVQTALINAKNRGCQVRFIMDAGNSTAYAQGLSAAGIPVITSTYGGNHGSASGFGIMHSKYLVVDAKSPNKDDAYVWTGSWNCSVNGQDDAQNALVLHDWGLAQAYTLDFEQMWGGDTPLPNATNSRMGSRKRDLTPHLFSVGGIPIEAYMSPSDNVEPKLLRNIRQTQHSVLACLLLFTSDTLSHYMKLHRDSLGSANYAVGLVLDASAGPGDCASGSEYCKLDGQPAYPDYWSPRADVLLDGSTAFDLLHHKYAILDHGYPNAAVWTGSHNWSNAANTVNDENSIILHDPVTAGIYFQEWSARYHESGGTLVGVSPALAAPGALELAQSRPNPTSGGASIVFTVPSAGHVSLGIYDLTGRRVRSLVEGRVEAGSHAALWDGRDESGAREPAGVYWYRLATAGRTVSRKLILTP
jgi:phosphatidylserine/phosphatidylglycerophosphate/cardiolipin synthase-like enzyme